MIKAFDLAAFSKTFEEQKEKTRKLEGELIKNKLDVMAAFNKTFEEQKDKTKKLEGELTKNKLDIMNETANNKKKLYDMSVLDIMIGIKDTWFNIIDDLLNKNISISTFTKDNNLFYIGITILIITLAIYIYNVLFNKDNSEKNENIQKIYHIYKYDPDIKQ
jgi:hypothetical protein